MISPQQSTGMQLVSGSFDNTVRVWDVARGTTTRTLHGHEDNVNKVVLHPQGDRVASGSEDGSARIWDLGVSATDSIAFAGSWLANSRRSSAAPGFLPR